MAVSSSSSAQAARQVLADRLSEICRDAGLEGKQLALECGWHPSKVSRIANAKTSPSADDILAWCRACGVEGQAQDLLASLRDVEGMWLQWHRMERSGLRRAQEAILPLFERTRWYRDYSPDFIPGLLQTSAYTEDVLRAVQQRRVAVDDVADAVAVRMERQRVLYEGQKRFAFLMEESALTNSQGTAATQIEQLEHLLTVGAMPNVSVGVVPARIGRTRMPVEGFYIFDNAQANVELVSGYLTLTQPSEVKAYADAFATMADMAVYGAKAKRMITAVMDAVA
ncbi:putative transcriptional regulator [Streptomyces sp. NBRC 110611]|uniref:helix-turn-helix domain-containing protein n=1 Tax=Streptomyces sp. NBRC 110611 TaxID=1621259 RepID=UPI000836AE2F|nr:helix-turn-helix transcriptional regulator [Streptomyces sp. NBRC 110611]GAU65104.1 putative transcriptional regulator [Streptomyces sp. NBRC 110611]